MVFDETFPDEYPSLQRYTRGVKKAERTIVGRDVEMDRILAAMMRPELCNVILLAEAGSGKAHANGTPVAVCDDRGYVPIEELRIGDFVFGKDGHPVKVLGVYPQGKLDAYEVRFADGTCEVCNDEHIWNVRTALERYRGKDYHNMTLRELLDRGVSDGSCRYYVPIQSAVQRLEKVNLLPGYLAGLLLSDLGSYDSIHHQFLLRISDSSMDEIVARLLEEHKIVHERMVVRTGVYYMFPDLFSDQPDMRWTFVMQNHVPDVYFLGSVSQRMSLLQALMDVKGVIGLPRKYDLMLEFSNVGLCLDVQRLCNSLGIRTVCTQDHISPRLIFQIPDRKKIELFTLPEIRGKIENVLENRPGKLTRYDNGLAIVSVRKLADQREMTCIYVDASDHLYQVGYQHIVTHNTALVQGTMLKDPDRIYLEVDLSKMISDLSDSNQMADRLKTLFDEVQGYSKAEHQEIVLFMDEFHQVVQLSDAAVEALKPLLADSGTRGIRVIAATTYEEFRKYISPNQPLVERLQRINLEAPGKEMVVEILKGMATRYGVNNQFLNSSIFEAIYDYTNRYIPASAQPRKSILVLDSMVGWYKYKRRKLNMQLLADVIYESTGVNVAFRVDATKIEAELNKKVFAQEYATREIAKRLQVCVADLHDKNKPMSSFLFTGSTGTGKALDDDTLVPYISEDGVQGYKRHGDLVVGDYVFNREGQPRRVIGVYPQGELDAYKIVFKDGREVICNDEHLWQWSRMKGTGANCRNKRYWRVTTLKDMIAMRGKDDGSVDACVPINGAIQFSDIELPVDPYVLGAFLGDGCLSSSYLRLCTDDEFVAEKVCGIIGAEEYARMPGKTEFRFYSGEMWGKRRLLVQTSDVFGSTGLTGLHAELKFIPEIYFSASVNQRMRLLQGLMDTDGSIHDCRNKKHSHKWFVSYATVSNRLACDVVRLVQSLGFVSTITINRSGDHLDVPLYVVNILSHISCKRKFFTLPRRKKIAEYAYELWRTESWRTISYDIVGVDTVEKLEKKLSMSCIMVDDDEHLYQLANGIVTHNTEVTKCLAKILFDDDRRLIRFDCSEFANDDSLERFRTELTARVWERPYSIVLLDEIEKACAPVTKLLLQVLDDARLTDANNREVSFTNAYIVLTTNAGSEIYKSISQYASDDNGSGKLMRNYMKLIQESIGTTTGANRFPPELLGRINCIIPFQPLSEATLLKITQQKLMGLMKNVRNVHGVDLRISNDVMYYIVKDNLDTGSDSGGARKAVSKIESDVVAPVAAYINAHPDDKTLLVKIEGTMAFQNKNMLESNARVVVHPISS